MILTSQPGPLVTAACPKGSFRSEGQRCNQSVTEGPWGTAVNWVKAPGDMFSNMTQYRADGGNCEAKRLHIKGYVACEAAHVCAARQHLRDEKDPLCAASCPHKLGSRRRTMANSSAPPVNPRRRKT